MTVSIRPGVGQGLAVGDSVTVGTDVGTPVAISVAVGFGVNGKGETDEAGETAVSQAARLKTRTMSPMISLTWVMNLYQGYSRGGLLTNFR